MKGVFVNSFANYFIQQKSKSDWKEILKNVGLGRFKIILATSDIDTSYVEKIIDEMVKKLQVSKQNLLTELGKFFVIKTVPVYYKLLLDKFDNFVDFIHNLNKIHSNLTDLLRGVNPPLFGIENIKDGILLKYLSKSGTNLIDYAYGALIGMAQYYNQNNIKITKLNESEIKINC